jgi:ketosteroid isomerase-like protein
LSLESFRQIVQVSADTRKEYLKLTRRDTFSASAHGAAASDTIAELASMSHRANAALMQGDAVTYAATMTHTRDFTLMQPFGGKVVHGFDPSPEHLAQLGAFFRGGDFRQEIVQSIISDDVAVLVMIEHQSVEVGGLAMQQWPLRVTLAFQKEDGVWRLAHRHADPLVHGISVAHAAALARGAQG